MLCQGIARAIFANTGVISASTTLIKPPTRVAFHIREVRTPVRTTGASTRKKLRASGTGTYSQHLRVLAPLCASLGRERFLRALDALPGYRASDFCTPWMLCQGIARAIFASPGCFARVSRERFLHALDALPGYRASGFCEFWRVLHQYHLKTPGGFGYWQLSLHLRVLPLLWSRFCCMTNIEPPIMLRLNHL